MTSSHQRLSDDDDGHSHSFKLNEQVDVFIDGCWTVCKVVGVASRVNLKVRVFHEPRNVTTIVPVEHVAQMWTRVDPKTAVLSVGMLVFTKTFGGPYPIVAIHKSQLAILVDDWMRVILDYEVTIDRH